MTSMTKLLNFKHHSEFVARTGMISMRQGDIQMVLLKKNMALNATDPLINHHFLYRLY